MGAASGLEVADIFRLFGPQFRAQHPLPRQHLRVMSAIEQCRTPALGGQLYRCDQCGEARIVYHSCRNRHCPKCQSLDKERWLEQRSAELLPVPYFHVVFTLPEELNPLLLSNPRWAYDLLFRCASETLLEVAADPRHLGARIGVVAVLHTWSQTLTFHPHLHCIVPGGGLSLDRTRWLGCRPGFFLPVRVLSRVFRGKVLHRVRAAREAGELKFAGPAHALSTAAAFQSMVDELYGKEWVVYCKPPFGGPEAVLEYLGRYTHRVAISNHRLLRMDGDQVVFTWRDYAHGSRLKQMSLPAEEFIRRFLLHVLPEGFVRIRYYGLLACRNREKELALCRQLLGQEAPVTPADERQDWRDLLEQLTGSDPLLCPGCGTGHLRLVEELAPEPAGTRRDRAPP
jgi:hypothetical protein